MGDGDNRDTAEARQGVEPLFQPFLCGVDGCAVVVIGFDALDSGTEVVSGVEGVQHGVPVLVRGPVVVIV
jgi:hypothetical protein